VGGTFVTATPERDKDEESTAPVHDVDSAPADPSAANPVSGTQAEVESNSDDKTEKERIRDEAVEATLGYSSRLISWSKSGYRRQYPTHLVVFNAGVYTADGVEIWWGDLDLTLDESNIGDLAKRLGEQLFVVYEGSRWQYRHVLAEERAFAETVAQDAVVIADADGSVSVSDRWAARDGSETIRSLAAEQTSIGGLSESADIDDPVEPQEDQP
jgi:hypothetical protein